LAASLSHVESRQVRNDYTLRWNGKLYLIEAKTIPAGLRGANVRVESRLDGSLAVRHRERYLAMAECGVPESPPVAPPSKARRVQRASEASRKGSQTFDLKKAPKLGQAIQGSGYRRGGGSRSIADPIGHTGSGGNARFALNREALRTAGLERLPPANRPRSKPENTPGGTHSPHRPDEFRPAIP